MIFQWGRQDLGLVQQYYCPNSRKLDIPKWVAGGQPYFKNCGKHIVDKTNWFDLFFIDIQSTQNKIRILLHVSKSNFDLTFNTVDGVYFLLQIKLSVRLYLYFLCF